MKKLMITPPELSHSHVWQATYKVTSADNVCLVMIESRSAIEVVVAKITDHSIFGTYTRYYVSSPNFSAAIPWVDSLTETNWITEHLIGAGIPFVDAATVAQVLRDLGDF